MKVGYFINQYPKVSHSFIRREIQALEAQGVIVQRYALTAALAELADESDRAEYAKTRHLFRQSPLRIAASAGATFFRRPRRFFSALFLAIKTGWRSERGLLRHFAYLIEAMVIADWLRKDAAEHLHAHFGTNPATVAMLVNCLTGLPYSFTVHGPEEFDKPAFLSLAEKMDRSAFVVAISSFGRSQLLRWIEAGQSSKVKVVHCGLDENFHFGPLAPLRDRPRLICIGRLCEQKGQLLLVDALQRLSEEGVYCKLIFAGDGPLRGEIENRARQYGLEDRIRITGWISSAEIRKELEQTCAMVLPSFAEGLPVVIMEAMALGRPVISTYVAGIPELVIAGETGWLVPAGDDDALAGAIKEVLSAPVERLEAMGEKARMRVLQRHDAMREAARLKAHFAASIEVSGHA